MRPTLARDRPNLARTGRFMARHRPSSARCRPVATRLGPASTNIVVTSTTCGPKHTGHTPANLSRLGRVSDPCPNWPGPLRADRRYCTPSAGVELAFGVSLTIPHASPGGASMFWASHLHTILRNCGFGASLEPPGGTLRIVQCSARGAPV